jgi:hypothetical protein
MTKNKLKTTRRISSVCPNRTYQGPYLLLSIRFFCHLDVVPLLFLESSSPPSSWILDSSRASDCGRIIQRRSADAAQSGQEDNGENVVIEATTEVVGQRGPDELPPSAAGQRPSFLVLTHDAQGILQSFVYRWTGSLYPPIRAAIELVTLCTRESNPPRECREAFFSLSNLTARRLSSMVGTESG